MSQPSDDRDAFASALDSIRQLLADDKTAGQGVVVLEQVAALLAPALAG